MKQRKKIYARLEVQCEMFAKLGVSDWRLRSLYFSSTLHGAMLMISTFPDDYPVNEIKQKITQQFCIAPSQS
ncbi:hypothetical protein LOK74_09340 [Brevibacillus humidisoli]|uniref:hypothetical protein n=1 Tax=Brevibacillus humidisoli TaxID=2895522 RepID=UPI001E38B062|nr:hypothetical protein [Brevibacillus humidisoli]UFJ42671.1 hypothetical protein LOK74_09340 [Brevibacillus humidisoli]